MQYCGCWFVKQDWGFRNYLSQVELNAHTVIQSTASRTKLVQTFINDTHDQAPEIRYSFPLYDGVSVVSFKCTVGDKVIVGIVKEKNEANEQYQAAVARGEVAGLFAQSHQASDVFTTRIGNVPRNGKAVIEIEYVGELKHDAQSDGIRFTIPTSVAPRYGDLSPASHSDLGPDRSGKIEIAVDIEVDEVSHIEGISSPSHPIAVKLGRTTSMADEFKSSRANATLSLGSAKLDDDFVVIVNVSEGGIPRALLEEHPEIADHRALMATLVPKFNLPNIHPEIVFVVDRSGSMDGKIPTLVEALKVFLKSIPLSAKFNICSFGSSFSFLFPKSVPYDERSLQHALEHVKGFDSNCGGTNMLGPIQATIKRRLPGVPLEILVLTDGEIWDQQNLFDYVNESAKSEVRVFSLGIGAGASTSLVEGLARAGNGFAQFVQDNEKMDKRVVRMLKGALSPHIGDYQLEVNYSDDSRDTPESDEYEIIEANSRPKQDTLALRQKEASTPAHVSLFDPNFEEVATNPSAGRYDHLPSLEPPQELQAPNTIPGLFPFSRTCVFLLLPNSTKLIKSITLRGTCNDRSVQLEIPVRSIGKGKTIHQLAAKKAMLDTEEGRGWLSTAKAVDGTLLEAKHEADWDRIIEREAVRLGVEFQVAGKYCSFVAVETDNSDQRRFFDVSTDSRPVPPTLNRYAPPNVLLRAQNHFGSTFGNAASPGGLFGNTASNADFSGSVFGNTANTGGLFGSAPVAHAAFGFAAPPPAPAPTDSAAAAEAFHSAAVARASRRMETTHFRVSRLPAYYEAERQSPQLEGEVDECVMERFEDEDENNDMGYGLFDDTEPQASFIAALPASDLAEEHDTVSFGSSAHAPTTDKSPPPAPAKIPDTVEGKMHRIIDLQHFDGSWTASDELFKLAHVWRADFDDADFNCEDDDNKDSIKATLLAIAWLEKEAADDVEVWEMVVDKAKQWLADKHGLTNVDTMVKRAMTIFFP